jgi:hypothetical protein
MAGLGLTTARQSLVWMLPGLKAEKEKQLNRFYDKFMDQQTHEGAY